MSDPTTTPTTTPEAPAATQAAELIVGKFKDQTSFETGIREIARKLEYPILDDQPVIGEGAVFKDIDHAKLGYAAFEKLMAKRAQAATETKPDGPTDTPPKAGDDSLTIVPVNMDETVESVLTKAGLSVDDVTKTWLSDSKLTDAQYAALAKNGYPKSMVDQYMHGQAALASQAIAQKQQMVNEAATLVGGQEALANLFGWAAMNIPKDEIGDDKKPSPGTLNHRLNDPKLYKGAIAELQQRHAAAIKAGGAKPLINGVGGTLPTGGKIPGNEYFKVLAAARNGDANARARLVAHNQAK